MNLEDVGAALKVGQAKFNLAVKAARSHQGGVKGVGSVKKGNEPLFKNPFTVHYVLISHINRNL